MASVFMLRVGSVRLRPCDDNTREKREHQLLPSAVVFCAQYHSKNMTFDITSPDEPLGATSLLRAEIVKDFSSSRQRGARVPGRLLFYT